MAEGATPNEASHNPGLAAADNYDVGPPDLISDGDRSVRAGGGARARALLRNRRFLRLWIAQIISNLGDWAYLLAVQIGFAATLDPHQLVRATAVFLGVEGLTSAVVGLTIAGRSSIGSHGAR